jgi:putative transposase
VYCLLKLNLRRRTKKRLPSRDPMPLVVPARPNQVWSADYISDALYNGVRFRTFNVFDDFNREALTIEIDTSLPSQRLVRDFEQLKAERGLPDVLRTDNGPEFLGVACVDWCQANGILIDYIERASRTRTPSSGVSTDPTARGCSTPGSSGISTKCVSSAGHG